MSQKKLGYTLVEDWKKSKWGWVGLAIVSILAGGPAMIDSIPVDATVVHSIVAGAIIVAGFIGRALVMTGALKHDAKTPPGEDE